MSKREQSEASLEKSRVAARVYYGVDGDGRNRGHRHLACRVITSASGRVCDDTLRVVARLVTQGKL